MNTSTRKQESKHRNRVPFFLLLVVLGIVLLVVLLSALRDNETGSHTTGQSEYESTEYVEKWQEGTISHNGKKYKYNQNIKSYLFLGVDSDEPAVSVSNYTEGGQSDAMFLLVANEKNKTLSVVSINRNTMTRVETCYETGAKAGYQEMQICVQHGYGDGMNLSCKRAVDAVSYLFYNLPIHGYLSMRMGALPIMNDAVGGVEVTVLSDLKNESMGVDLKAGETVTLTGAEAYAYIRSRDIRTFGSATERLHRQEQYITAYITKLKTVTVGNPSAAVDIYESISDYIVSNMDFVSLISDLDDYTYTSEQMYTVPGETVAGEQYEEFHVNEEAFYEMMLEIFYEEVTE